MIAKEKPEGLLAGLGGQTALNLDGAPSPRPASSSATASGSSGRRSRRSGWPRTARRFRDLLDRIGQPYAPSFIVEGATAEARHAVRRRGPRDDRPARDRPPGVHPRRDRRRDRRDRGGLPRADPGRPPRQPDRPGDGREVPRRLAGDRVRGDARRRGHVHRGLLDGERRPARGPHRRLDRRRARPDAARSGPPAAAERGPRDHPGARRRGRLQRPVRALARLDRLRGHRGQPAGRRGRRRSRARRPATRSPASPPRSRCGRTLAEIPNVVTGTTVAAFEPALDYVVVKLPRFPFDKFPTRRPHASAAR